MFYSTGWKRLPGTNSLAYFVELPVTVKNVFYNIYKKVSISKTFCTNKLMQKLNRLHRTISACMLARMHCFQNALAYFAAVIRCKHKMFVNLTTVIIFITILNALLTALANQQSHLCSDARFSECTSLLCNGHKLWV